MSVSRFEQPYRPIAPASLVSPTSSSYPMSSSRPQQRDSDQFNARRNSPPASRVRDEHRPRQDEYYRHGRQDDYRYRGKDNRRDDAGYHRRDDSHHRSREDSQYRRDDRFREDSQPQVRDKDLSVLNQIQQPHVRDKNVPVANQSQFPSLLPSPKSQPQQSQHHETSRTHPSDTLRRVSTSFPSPPKPEFENNDIVAARFHILGLLGQGTYGDVYTARDSASPNQDLVAVKIDRNGVNNGFLSAEHKILKDMATIKAVPRAIQFGKVAQRVSDQRCFLAMSIHGESLSTIRKTMKGAVPNKICSALFVGMVEALASFHEGGYIHRDIKPSNFLLLTPACTEHKFERVIVIDFGLSIRYVDPEGNLLPRDECKTWKGTTRYASLSVHQQKAVSRADDLLSLMFVLLEFLGKLFWVKLNDRELVQKKKQSFLERIEFKNIPQPLIDIFQHLKSLQYEDKPDYDLVKSKLAELALVEDATEEEVVSAHSQGNKSPSDSSVRIPNPNADSQALSEIAAQSRKRSRSRDSDDVSAKRSKH